MEQTVYYVLQSMVGQRPVYATGDIYDFKMTPHYEYAKRFEKIGDAMKASVAYRENSGRILKVVSVYE